MNTELSAERARDAHLASKALELIQAGVLPEMLERDELEALTDTLTKEKEND